MRALVTLAVFAAAACGGSEQPRPVARLVDSLPWATEANAGFHRRVAVTVSGRTDTIPGVRAVGAPVTSNPGKLSGFDYDGPVARRAYEYDVASRSVAWIALPPWLRGAYASPALSPDARHVAYFDLAEAGRTRVLVRTWPRGDLVLTSQPVSLNAGDPPDIGHIRWQSPDTVQALVNFALFGGRAAWIHVLGSVRRRSAIRTDTIMVVQQTSPAGHP